MVEFKGDLKPGGTLNEILDIMFEDMPIESGIRLCEHCAAVVVLKDEVGGIDGEKLAEWFAMKAEELRGTKRAKNAFYSAL